MIIMQVTVRKMEKSAECTYNLMNIKTERKQSVLYKIMYYTWPWYIYIYFQEKCYVKLILAYINKDMYI